jgi:hypothetical protein
LAVSCSPTGGIIARKRAAANFKLELAEMEDRHRLTFDTYEQGKLALEEYLGRVVFYQKRPFTRAQFRRYMFTQSKPYPEMIELVAQLKVRHGHGRGRRGPMPVPLAGREPDHVPGTDLLDRTAFALNPVAAGRDDESLTERMRMPCSPRARLEGYAGTLDKCRIAYLKKRIDPYGASEPP